jgi:hypothetical protein
MNNGGSIQIMFARSVVFWWLAFAGSQATKKGQLAGFRCGSSRAGLLTMIMNGVVAVEISSFYTALAILGVIVRGNWRGTVSFNVYVRVAPLAKHFLSLTTRALSVLPPYATLSHIAYMQMCGRHS